MLKFLFRLTFRQALPIIGVLSLPLLFWVIDGRVDAYQAAKLSGRIGSIYLLLAFSLYLFLYAISHLRKSGGRQRLVTFTRVYIRFHSSLAVVGSFFIVWHLVFMVIHAPATSTAVAGYLTAIALLPLLLSGYLRGRKSSGRRRRVHRYMAFLFVGMLLIHVLV